MTTTEINRKFGEIENKLRRIVVNRCEEMPTTNVGKIVIFDSQIYFWNGADYERILTEDDLASLVTEAELAWLTQDIEDALVNANTPNALNPYATLNDLLGIPDPITVVANYSALPNPTTVAGRFYWAESPQGTQWLPGSLGGTYYNSGIYYSNGTIWTYIETPYQATQLEVDTATNNNKFVTPLTGQAAYAFKPGVAGGQTLNGGTLASNNLTLSSTSNITKGSIIFGDSRYNEATNRLSFGTASGTGRINLPDGGTTAADGIWFGTSLSLYRLSSTTLRLDDATTFRLGFLDVRNSLINSLTGIVNIASPVTMAPSTLTGSSATSALSISQTYNTTGTPTFFELNLTDTASNAATLFVNLRRNGSSVFNITKGGILSTQTISVNGNIGCNGLIDLTGQARIIIPTANRCLVVNTDYSFQTTPRALFEVKSTTQGLLLPRMTTTQRNAIATTSIDNGLIIFNLTTLKAECWDGSAWQQLH